MLRPRTVAALLLWLHTLACTPLAAAVTVGGPLTVTTDTGILTGFINSTAPNVRQFLGVPYAEPPLGSLRFQPPVKTSSSENMLAQSFGPSCMQAPSATPYLNGTETLNPNASVYALMPEFFPSNGVSEDCLYLNVYAPLNPTAESLPVFLWIHGGGFTSDSASVPYQIPDKWIQRTQSHVFVTMNYRLGVFGFPNALGQMQNVGLLDQRLVVEWARDNIAAFGGDPDRMVLMGQSAGSAAVNYYAYSYVDDPIVSGFIAHSGAASILTLQDTSGSNFTALASAVGCASLSAEEKLACMQDVNATALEVAVVNNSQLSFVPFGDNITAPANATDRLAKGLVAKKPFIMGNTDNEGGFAATIGGETSQELGLEVLACPVIAEANQRTNTPGHTTYRYLYTGNFSNIAPLPWIAACHSCDLPLVFGTHYEFDNTHTGLNSTPLEWETSFAMEGLWLAFASNTSANPTYGNFTWQKYDRSSDTISLFGHGTALQTVGALWFDGNCSSLS